MLVKDYIIKRYSNEVDKNQGCAKLDDFLFIRSGNRILELGCGRGYQLKKFSQEFVDSNFVGLDINEELINFAKVNNNNSNIKYVVGEIEKLPFIDNEFDIVFSNCVINHSMEKDKVYSEIFRVLKRNGYFLVGDIVSVDGLPDYVRNDPKAIADCYGGALQEKDYLTIIKNSGFFNIEILSRRRYYKNNFLLESLVIKGVKL